MDGTNTRQPARIVVADDDAGMREWIRDSLESAGYEVLEAADGRAGVQLLSQAPVALFITDLAMPEQEGIETIRILRHDHPALKIIAISGAFGPDFLRVSRVLGAGATLQKPIRLERLLETVRKLLAA